MMAMSNAGQESCKQYKVAKHTKQDGSSEPLNLGWIIWEPSFYLAL